MTEYGEANRADWRTRGNQYGESNPFDLAREIAAAEETHGSEAHHKRGGDRACPKCHLTWSGALDVAQERKREAEAARWPEPDAGCWPPDLTFSLSQPETDRRWLLDRLIGADHNVIVSAVFKAGKTTFALNLAAHLAAGESFLGRDTDEWSGNVAVSYWNLEVSREDFNEEYARGLDMPGGVCSAWDGKPAATRPDCPGWKDPGFLWKRCGGKPCPWQGFEACRPGKCSQPGECCQGQECGQCQPGECCHDCPGDWRTLVRPVHLRTNPVPLLDGEGARRWALHALRGTRVWIIDTWARFAAWHNVDTNDNAAVSGLLSRLDEFKQEAGVGCVIFTAHSPHAAKTDRVFERALGAQSFSGWADGLVFLTVNDAGERFVRAEGRGVSLPETRIEFAPGSTRLTAAGGSRADAEETRVRFQLCQLIRTQPGIGAKALREACGVSNPKTDAAVAALVKDGIVVKIGGRNGQMSRHYLKGDEP